MTLWNVLLNHFRSVFRFRPTFWVTLAGFIALQGCQGANPFSMTSSVSEDFYRDNRVDYLASRVASDVEWVRAGESIDITFTPVNSEGKIAKPKSITVEFSLSGGTSTGTFSPTAANSDGTFSSQLTGAVAGSASQIIVTVDGQDLQGSAPSIQVLPGDPVVERSEISLSSSSVTSGSSVLVTLIAKDALGNRVTEGGLSGLSFGLFDGTSTGSFGSVVDVGDGTYTAVLTGIVAGAPSSVGVYSNSSRVSLLESSEPSITVVPGPASAAHSLVSVSSSTVLSGSQVTLTLTAKDANSNPVDTGGAAVAFVRSGGTSTGTISSAVDLGNGTYRATFTGVIAGSATTISATLGGTAVSAPFPTVTVSPGPFSQSQSLVSVSLSTVYVSTSTTLTLTTKDAAGNLITSGGLTVGFSHSGGTSAGTIGSVTNQGNGTYRATFTGSSVGTATTIQASINSQSVTSSLPSVTVAPGSYDLDHSTISLSSSSVTAGSQITATLTLKDEDDNLFPAAGVAVVFNHSGGTSTGSFGSVTDNNDGTYSASFTGAAAGTATTIGATAGGNAITWSPLPTVTVSVGAPSAAQSSLSASPSTGVTADGSTASTITLTIRDSQNNAISGYDASSFNLSSTGTGNTFGSWSNSGVTNASGQVTKTIVSTKAEQKNILISAPAGFTGVTATQVTFVAGAASAGNSSLSASPSTGVTADGSTASTITLTIRDAQNNPVSGYDASGFSLSATGSGEAFGSWSNSGTTNASGQVTMTITSTVAEQKDISISAPGGFTGVTATQVTFAAGSASAGNSSLSASPSSGVTANGSATSTITLTIKDAQNNPVSGYDVSSFSLSSTGTANSFGNWSNSGITNASGQVTKTITSTKAEQKDISISAPAGFTGVAATQVTFDPGAVSRAMSEISVSSASVAAGSNVTVTLTAKDSNGNQLSAGGLTVVFNRSGGTSTGSFGGVTDHGNGTYSASFTGGTAGTATTIGATIGGSAVTWTPLPTVTVTVGAPSAGNTSLSASPSTGVTADGSTTSTITLTLRDSQNNLISGYDASGFTLSSSGSGNSFGSWSNSGITNGSGQLTMTIASTVAEQKSISISAPAGLTGVTATQVTFVAGAASAGNSSLSASPSSGVTADGSTTSTITLTIRDAQNNPVSGYDASGFSLSSTGTGNTFGSWSNAGVTNASGQVTKTISSTKAEQKDISISAPAGFTGVAATQVTFVAGSASADTSSLSASPSSGVTADGSTTSTITLTIRDAESNPVSGYDASGFSLSSTGTGNSFGSWSNSGVTNASGQVTMTITSTKAEQKNISISAPGGFTGVAATQVTFVAGAASAGNSSLSASPSTGVTANGVATSTITLTIRDAQNNPVSGYDASGFTLSATGSGGESFGSWSNSGTTNASGQVTMTISSVDAEQKDISISAPGGFTGVAATQVTFVSETASLSQSEVAVSSGSVTAGSDVTVTLTAKDAGGSQLVSGGLTVAFNHSGGTSTGSFGSVTDNNDGTYTATFTGTTAGTATTIGATIGGAAVTWTPLPTVTVSAGSASAGNSSLSASPSTGVTADGSTTSTITLTIRDTQNNPISGYDASGFTLSSTGTGNSFGSWSNAGVTNASGQVTMTIASTKAEQKSISISAPGGFTGVTATQVTFVAGAASSGNSSLSASPSTGVTADGSTASTITLTIRDAQNNPISGYDASGFTLSSTGTGNSFGSWSNSGTTNASGQVTMTITSTKAEQKDISISAPGGFTGVSATQVTFVPGAASAGNSSLSASPSTGVTANGSATSTITLTIRDAQNNPISGYDASGFTLSATGSGESFGSWSNSSTTDASGQVTKTIASTKAEEKDISISDPPGFTGVTATQVTFDPGAASLSNSEVAVSAGTVESGSQITVTLTAIDAQGNPLDSGGLTVAFNHSGGTSTGSFGSVTDHGDGTYSASFTGATAGTATTIGATIDSNTVIWPSLPTVTVTAPALSLSESLVQVSSSSVRFNNEITLTLIAKDEGGNQFSTGGLTVVFSNSGGTSTGTISGTTDVGDGTYTATFTGVTPGTATTISATIDGDAVTSTLPTVTVTGVNLVVPIELTDFGFSSSTSVRIFDNTRTNFDTSEYDGTSVTYTLEIVATNANTTNAYNVQLVNSSDTVVRTISVPASTTAPTRFAASMALSGSDNYRMKTAATASVGQLDVYSARLLVRQVNATKTRIYVPLLANTHSTVTGSTTTTIYGTTDTSYSSDPNPYATIWKKDTSNFSTLAAGSPYTLEVVGYIGTAGGTAYFGLINSDTDALVTGAEVSTTDTSFVNLSQSFADNAANFTNGQHFDLRLYRTTSGSALISKAGLWIRLTNLSKGEVYYRVEKRYAPESASKVTPNSRIQLNTSYFNSANVNVFYEVSGYGTSTPNFTLRLADHGVNDSGTSSTSAVTNCAVSSASLGTSLATIARARSSACSGVTDGNRFINELVRTGGSAYTTSQFVVVQFQD